MSDAPAHDTSWNQLEAQLMDEMDSASNGFKAKNGHECRLPVFINVPVALNPLSGTRADVGLSVRCMACQVIWIATRSFNATFSALDNCWVELDLSTIPWWKRRKFKPQQEFDATEYYMAATSCYIDGARSTMP